MGGMSLVELSDAWEKPFLPEEQGGCAPLEESRPTLPEVLEEQWQLASLKSIDSADGRAALKAAKNAFLATSTLSHPDVTADTHRPHSDSQYDNRGADELAQIVSARLGCGLPPSAGDDAPGHGCDLLGGRARRRRAQVEQGAGGARGEQQQYGAQHR